MYFCFTLPMISDTHLYDVVSTCMRTFKCSYWNKNVWHLHACTVGSVTTQRKQEHHNKQHSHNLQTVNRASEVGQEINKKKFLKKRSYTIHLDKGRQHSMLMYCLLILVILTSMIDLAVKLLTYWLWSASLLCTTLLSQWNFSQGKFGLPSLGKATCDRVAIPNLRCMLGVLAFP